MIAQGTNSRNEMRFNSDNTIFSCYGEKSTLPRVYLYENNDELAIPIAAACTDGTKCYGTFSSTKAFVAPNGLTVSEIAIQSNCTMRLENYATGDVVPANTGVMVSAAEGGYYTVNVSTDEGTSKLSTSNALRPSGDDGITADEMDNNDSNCKFYRLTMHNGTDIGFWWGAENGAAFAVAANKAYMAVPAGQTAREGFSFDNETNRIGHTEIREITEKAGAWYDLQGRRISVSSASSVNAVLPKGVYIVNGKKTVVK